MHLAALLFFEDEIDGQHKEEEAYKVVPAKGFGFEDHQHDGICSFHRTRNYKNCLSTISKLVYNIFISHRGSGYGLLH